MICTNRLQSHFLNAVIPILQTYLAAQCNTTLSVKSCNVELLLYFILSFYVVCIVTCIVAFADVKEWLFQDKTTPKFVSRYRASS